MSPFRSTALLAVLVLCVLSAPADAQTLRISLDRLTEVSDDVIVGKTVRTESYWTADRSAILTRVVIQVEESLAGGATGEREVTVPGGRVGDYLHEVSDMPVFVVDEEVMVFTARHASGLTIVAGGVQGKMEIVRDADTGARVVRGAAHLFEADADGFESDQTLEADEEKAAVRLDVLTNRVKTLRARR